MNQNITVGGIQFDVLKADIRANMKTILTGLEQLAEKGVTLAVLPEMFSCSFDHPRLPIHCNATPGIIEEMRAFCRTKQMAVSGSLPVMDAGRIFNVHLLIDAGGDVKAEYRKIHLFRLTGEDNVFSSGRKVVFSDLDFGRVGLITCYDLRFPELSRALFLHGVRILLVCAQWPAVRVAHWETLLRARAIENQMFVIGVNRTGTEDGLEFPGSSMIIGPSGKILHHSGAAPGHFYTEIDLDAVSRARDEIPCFQDRKQEVYG